MENVEMFQEMMNSFIKEITTFYEKGNVSAGRRARKISVELTHKMKAFRAESVQASKKD